MPLNLVQHREGPSVWEREAAGPTWDLEGCIAAMLAGGLLFAGSRQRTAGGWLMGAAGGALAWWALSPTHARNHCRGRLRALLRRERDDAVMEASEESFPASDPPAWTSTSTHTTAHAPSGF